MTETTPLPNIPHATDIEKKIVGKLVADLLADGCELTVNDGEENTVIKSIDPAVIFDALSSTGYDWLIVSVDGHRIGSVLLVWGNGPDVISDASVSLPDSMIAGATALAEELR